MIRLVALLAVAIAIAIAAVWFAENPGLVLIEWEGRRVETSVGIAVLAVLAIAVVVTVLVILLRALTGAPGRWRRGWRRSRAARGQRALSTGLIAAAAGDPLAARGHARRARRLLPADPAVLLLTAQSAQLDGDEDAAFAGFRAMLATPETEFLGLRGLLGQAARIGDPDEAIDLARRAFRLNPSAPWTSTTLFDLLTRQQRWAEALPLIETIEAHGRVEHEVAKRHKAALELLVSRERLAAGEAAEALAAARRGFRLAPSFAPVAVAASRSAAEVGRTGEARRTVERAWEIRPHPDLAHAYADLAPEETAPERLRRFDRLRRRQPEHLETLGTMAELALAAGDTRLARDYVDRVVARGHTSARACRLMAEVLRASGAPQVEIDEWLTKAGEARRDPAWVCEDTGEVLPAWQPFGRTGRFDRVSWTIPPDVAPLLVQRLGPVPTPVIGASSTAPEAAHA